MTTILIATTPDEVQNLLPWASLLADSRGSQLSVLLTQRKKGETRLVEMSSESSDDDSELVSRARHTLAGMSPPPSSSEPVADHTTESASAAISMPSAFQAPADRPKLYQVVGEQWANGLSQIIAPLSPSLVIVPAPESLKQQNDDDAWQTSVLATVDCDVVVMRDDSVAVTGQLSIGVFLRDRADNETALNYSAGLAERFGGRVTAVYIEPAVGDDAASVGRRQVAFLLDRLVSPRVRGLFTADAVVASKMSEAFQAIDPAKFDLLIFGTRDLREMRRFLKASPGEGKESDIPAVAVVSQGASFSSRLWNRMDGWARSFIPQLSREERINLVMRIQSSSQWDFDFVCLISLATLIACLGLAENSGAVIVGAMLVAPLMTPIAGVGLGVAHANAYLTKIAFRTALRGFATAVLIGVLFGLCVQGCAAIGWLAPLDTSEAVTAATEFPSEMENRTRPQFYDLLIALASGLVAAYAMGRPNLYSALPGVAIAAALVPPIATSGIALSHGDITKGGGALLLFVTNMVVIILGTSLVFRMVGIRSQKDGPNAARWPRYTLLLLVVLSVLITVVIEFNNRNMHRPVDDVLIEKMEKQLEAIREQIADTQVSTTIAGETSLHYNGSEISFESLPPEVQHAIRSEFE